MARLVTPEERAVIELAREFYRACFVIGSMPPAEPLPTGTSAAWSSAMYALLAAVDALERLEAGA